MAFHPLKVSPTITPNDQTWPAGHTAARPASPEDAPFGGDLGHSRISLLAAIDFKWLMTGHGWWVDSARFHTDPRYAITLLDLALASPSAALQVCAARLRAQMGRDVLKSGQ